MSQNTSIEEISVLNEEFKEIIETEDISEEEKTILLTICHDIDIAKFEYKLLETML